ncbi:DUF2391 family protein [Pseudofulvibacter geojedonensis]|uniref:DUF2391 family protein n=1 Tax=Pseudofulvibacter geojedonensis TaxID=1123758 RepID=A0ABW3I1P0_9FLAO
MKYFNKEDFAQIIIGSTVVSLPIAFTKEFWDLSFSLPIYNIVLMVVISLIFIMIYTAFIVFESPKVITFRIIIKRTILNYIITIIMASIVLITINKLSLFIDTLTSIKRILILSFPASIGSVMFDGLDKEG